MKKGRHSKIIELIRTNEISTQDELLLRLKDSGHNVTQATVSRDIKELNLIKLMSKSGKYCYATSSSKPSDVKSNLVPLFSSSVVSVEYAQNLVVIKTVPGMAQAVCTSIDAANFEEIIGSIAGDDTIFLAAKSTETAISVSSKLKVMSY
ncbi:MAG: arginine repressor [Lachnospiraceae bacterium]|nr:arginine repressor [Lachnospiraceae bacterium]